MLTFTPNCRLGNLMFEFASMVGIRDAHPANVTWTICRERKMALGAGAFPRIAALPVCDGRLPDPQIEHHSPDWGRYDVGTRRLPVDRNIRLRGFRQSWKYFENCSEEVRDYFRFATSIADRANATLQSALTRHFCRGGNLSKFTSACSIVDDVIIIGVHVRRGDMVGSNESYPVPDVDFLQRAMLHHVTRINTAAESEAATTVRRRPRVVFVVCSDGMTWCRENLAGRDDVIFIESGVSEVDLAVLASCRHSIITAGTFGWWAAWLAGGFTVYYRDFPGPRLRPAYDSQDYYPPGWVGLS